MSNHQEKKYVVRLTDKECVEKLRHLIQIEIQTLDNLLKHAERVKSKLVTLDIPNTYKENILSAYDMKVAEFVVNVHVHNIVNYMSLLAYAEALSREKVLYALEDTRGRIDITYIPKLIKKYEK